MKLTILTYLLFLTSSLVGQNYDFLNTNKNKLSIGVNFSVDLTYRNLIIDNPLENTHNYVHFLDSTTNPKTNFSLGINLHHFYNHRLFFDVSLIYGSTGYESVIFEIRDLDNGVDFNSVRFITSRNFINAPLKFNYKLLNGRFSPYLSTGLSSNFLLSDNYTRSYVLENGDNRIQTEKKVSGNKFNLSILLGMGLFYSVNEKYGLKLNPEYRYDIIPFEDNYSYDEFQYSYSVNICLIYNL